MAALIYFKEEIVKLVKRFVEKPKAILNPKGGEEKELQFLAIATAISGLLGFLLYAFIIKQIKFSGEPVLVFIGILLILMGLIPRKESKGKGMSAITWKDGLFLGVLQGFAVFPGISRSGITIAGLLSRNYNQSLALRLSFLMSIPAVLGAEIFLHLQGFRVDSAALVSLFTAFIVGYATISLLLKVAEKVKFGHFCVALGLIYCLPILVYLI
jgi:undecaprenyl-diphosphatase